MRFFLAGSDETLSESRLQKSLEVIVLELALWQHFPNKMDLDQKNQRHYFDNVSLRGYKGTGKDA